MTDPKVTLNPSVETPTAQAVKTALREAIVEDARGRVITLRKPPVLAQFQLVEALGPKTAQNNTYVSMCLPLLFVTQIDDVPVYLPNSKAEMEALIQLLDEDGIGAVIQGVQDNFEVQNSDEVAASVKK